MSDGVRYAPFTDDEVVVLKLWQENDYLHPYTCCEGEAMEVSNDGLKCAKCGRAQNWVHDFSLNEKTATYNPYKGLNIEEDENETKE